MERFARLAAQALNTVLETPITATDLESPPDPKMGDFGFPCFKLSKIFRKGPPQVAQEITSQLQAAAALEKVGAGMITVAAVGPYVNFTVARDETLKALLGDILAGEGNGSYGSLTARSRGKWVLEYSSPNVAKPFNIYHLRPTALGAALDRIGRFRGYDMVGINHLGDWGTQYGKLAVAFREYGQNLPADPSIEDLVQIYVKFHAEAETNPKLEDEARLAFLKLEQGDAEMTALWKKCVDISMREFERLYARLGVKFDHIWGESYYKDLLPGLLVDLKKRGLLVESEGAQVVEVSDAEGKAMPPCIMQKTDGATIYATRDVAAALYRFEKFSFDRMTYVVGGEQRLHFQQIFAVLRRMGADWVSRCEHVPTGLYRFKDAKMSTRKGNFITLDEVLELSRTKVKELMRAREAQKGEAGLSEAELDTVAEAIGVGAVVFHDLHTDPARDVEFDIDRVVDFEGETGPYLQYAHTRCLSILRKARESGEMPKGELFQAGVVARLEKDEELALVKTLGQFPLHLERTLQFGKASQLAHYLIDVTRVFGGFYRECKVLGEAPELTRARLMLVESTRRVLAQGLSLMGIKLPERM